MKVERKCKIVSKEQMGDAIYMVLEAGDMVRTSFRAPGQFVHVKCGEGPAAAAHLRMLLHGGRAGGHAGHRLLRSGVRAPTGWPAALWATVWMCWAWRATALL